MLKLGIIGSSPGNGHPYSWSAIFNGYEPDAMAECPYPVIPAYLAKQRFPEDRLANGQVTHIWTQDPENSRHIAQASRIAHVVDNFSDLIGKVDGVLLARDDAEHHEEMAVPFLRAGMPVYIDKPLALDRQTERRIFAEERFPGQIYTGTPLTHAVELMLDSATQEQLGEIRHVHAVTPKYWNTYAVHIIEPVLAYLDLNSSPVQTEVMRSGEAVILVARWENGKSATFTVTGSLPAKITFDIFGTDGHEQRVFADSFNAFKTSLQRFCTGVQNRQRMFDLKRQSLVTELIECGSQEMDKAVRQ
ncbi:Gfo/Idh/MocA family oxidoreductase [Dongia soli]|uniref:Gfo/Idh/MocA family oxidoreductase n=1 Tax=Dongia soli TaxID=600628 RepID=A0ABU5EA67_9PROT|nr:Gfo/Idh/MocA family oxidoreductase [Dongia soli]MDY0883243.1 Gfo/Idh/MocA family oxidoreductase [Dongia soli]